MLTNAQKSRIAATLASIKAMLDTYYPGDNLKVAVEICSVVLAIMGEDLEIVDTIKDYWIYLANGQNEV